MMISAISQKIQGDYKSIGKSRIQNNVSFKGVYDFAAKYNDARLCKLSASRMINDMEYRDAAGAKMIKFFVNQTVIKYADALLAWFKESPSGLVNEKGIVREALESSHEGVDFIIKNTEFSGADLTDAKDFIGKNHSELKGCFQRLENAGDRIKFSELLDSLAGKFNSSKYNITNEKANSSKWADSKIRDFRWQTKETDAFQSQFGHNKSSHSYSEFEDFDGEDFFSGWGSYERQDPPKSFSNTSGLYLKLGLSANADKATVKKAHRDLAIKYHPDKNPGNKAAEEKMKEINDAKDKIFAQNGWS